MLNVEFRKVEKTGTNVPGPSVIYECIERRRQNREELGPWAA